MKNGVIKLLCAGGCVAAVLTVRASVKSAVEDHSVSDRAVSDHSVSSDNPYGAITERNIFDLHDPPPPVVDDKKDKGPPPNLKLTGITTIFGKSQALFILNKPGAAGKPPASQSLILNEGQRSGEVEVLEINPKARTAKVKIDEAEALLTIETNKGTINMPANAGAPGVHAPPPGTPPGFPHNPYGAPPGGGDKGIPQRPTRTDIPPNSPQAYNSGNPYGAGAPGIQTPQGNMSLTGPAATGTVATQPNQQLSQDEQAILIEAAHAQAQATGDSSAAIFPPTVYSPQPPSQEPPNESSNPNPNPNPSSQLPAALQPKGNIYIPGH